MKGKRKNNTYSLSVIEQMLLKLNVLIMGFFILVTWLASGMTLAVYTIVHFILLLVTLGILIKGTRRRFIGQIVVILGLIGSISAIWLTVSYASFFN